MHNYCTPHIIKENYENFLIHPCNYILLSRVYCVWQVVKTPTIILNNPVYIYYIWEISNNILLWFWGFVGSAWWWTSVETCSINITGINKAPCWTEQCVFVWSIEHDAMDTVKLTCSNVGIIKLFYISVGKKCVHINRILMFLCTKV